jgi:GNAT superfamily N-acetyltransferase
MTNLERMTALAEQFFEAKNDPDQIAVDERVMERLRSIHPATLSEASDENGPIAWLLLVPTTQERMEQFIRGDIGERGLLEPDAPGVRYEAIYLCSALVLPEHRGRGLARRLAVDSIRSIQADHPIREFFVWAFSEAGMKLAESLAHGFGLPLYRRRDRA